MSRAERAMVDPVAQLAAVAEAVRECRGAGDLLRALDHALAATLGHRLFTVMRYHRDSGESERIYSSNPQAYPVGGRKALQEAGWVDRVFRQRQPFLGRNAADLREVFPDHRLIASLGLQSVLNLPVARGAAVLGTLNLLHQENWYDAADFALGTVFAALAIPVFDLVADR